MKDDVELKLNEPTELLYKVSIDGAEGPLQSIQFVCEVGDVSYRFKGEETTEDGIASFIIPSMRAHVKPGTYAAHIEVMIENQYFKPAEFRVKFVDLAKVVVQATQVHSRK